MRTITYNGPHIIKSQDFFRVTVDGVVRTAKNIPEILEFVSEQDIENGLRVLSEEEYQRILEKDDSENELYDGEVHAEERFITEE